MPTTTRAVTRFTPARVRTRYLSRTRTRYVTARRHGAASWKKQKVSLAVLAGLAFPVGQTVRWYRMYKAGSDPVNVMNAVGQAFLHVWLGSPTGNWNPTGKPFSALKDTLTYTYAPIAAGIAVHKIANRFGLNRYFRRIPFVSI